MRSLIPMQEFTYIEKEDLRLSKKKKVKAIVESREVRLERAYQEIVDGLYSMVADDREINLERLEKIVFTALKKGFNNAQSALITGVSLRTVRNKLKEYNNGK